MAEDLVNHAEILANLDPTPCITQQLRIRGYHQHSEKFGDLAHYGSDAPAIQDLMRRDKTLQNKIHRDLELTVAQVVWAARHEMARTVDDILARRNRALLLNARAALESCQSVATLLARELNKSKEWIAHQQKEFTAIHPQQNH